MNTLSRIATLGAVSALAVASSAVAAEPAHEPAHEPAQTQADQQAEQTQTDANTDAAGTRAQGADIVVTAQRRQESVTDVPISITVADQSQLERQQVNQVNDLSRIAPSLEIQAAPGQNTGGGGSIRGIGTLTFGAGAVPSVGIVVDGVSQGNANISNLFDIDRVEVLKGPQGTLFGLTTSAGVINISTNDPDPNRYAARVRAQVSAADFAGSKFGNQVIQAMANVPVSDDAAVRVSGVANLRQGPDRNALNGDYNDINDYSVRGRGQWRPTDDLKIDLLGDYAKSSFTSGGDFFTFVRGQGPGPILGGAAFDPVGVRDRLASCGVTAGVGNRDFCTAQDQSGHSENYGGSFQVAYAADPFTLTSITSYRESRSYGAGFAGNVFRADPLELEVLNGDVNRKLDLFTQEFRVDSPNSNVFEYTVGAFFSTSTATREPESLSVTLTPAPGVSVPVARDPGFTSTVDDDSLAVFGQGTVHVTPDFRLIAGGRYTSQRLALDYTRPDLDSRLRRQLNTGVATYRFGAQYDLGYRTMAYATASRGYKGGQIALPAAPDTPYVVRPETNHAYELGLKTSLFGGMVVDLNAFYEKFDSFQSQQCTTNPQTAALVCVQTNVNDVKTRGAEVNLFGEVAQGLSLNTGFLYAKATYPDTFVGTDSTDIGGTQLPYSPRYKFTFSGQYEQPVSGGLKALIAVDTQWKSKIRYEANSYEETTYPDHWIVGGRVGLSSIDDRFTLALFARNLFNEHEPLLLQSDLPYGGPANVGAIYGPTSFREVGLSLDAKF